MAKQVENGLLNWVDAKAVRTNHRPTETEIGPLDRVDRLHRGGRRWWSNPECDLNFRGERIRDRVLGDINIVPHPGAGRRQALLLRRKQLSLKRPRFGNLHRVGPGRVSAAIRMGKRRSTRVIRSSGLDPSTDRGVGGPALVTARWIVRFRSDTGKCSVVVHRSVVSTGGVDAIASSSEAPKRPVVHLSNDGNESSTQTCAWGRELDERIEDVHIVH